MSTTSTSVGGQEFPRPMTEEEWKDAETASNALRTTEQPMTASMFQWCTGPYWPHTLRKRADQMEKAIPAMRRMADWLDARQPNQNERLTP